MEEIFRWAVEGGAFGISLFLAYILFKKFIKEDVIKPIKEIKKDYDELKESFTKFSDRFTNYIFKLVRSNLDLGNKVTQELTGMQNLWTEATRHTSQAKLEASEALKKVNTLSETTDKLVKIATAVHEKNKALETEITKLNHDMIFVKTKVSKDET